MGTIANFKELEQSLNELHNVFTPEQFDKLDIILRQMLVILDEVALSKTTNKKLDEHWKTIHYIAEQGNFNLFKK